MGKQASEWHERFRAESLDVWHPAPLPTHRPGELLLRDFSDTQFGFALIASDGTRWLDQTGNVLDEDRWPTVRWMRLRRGILPSPTATPSAE